MANTQGMKFNFTVIKNDDVLSTPKGDLWMERLNNICEVVNVNRLPKNPNRYIVKKYR